LKLIIKRKFQIHVHFIHTQGRTQEKRGPIITRDFKEGTLVLLGSKNGSCTLKIFFL